MEVLNTIRGRLVEVEDRMTAINNASEEAKRFLSAEEKTELRALQVEHADLKDELSLREGVVAAKATTSEPSRIIRPVITGGAPNGAKAGLNGFRSHAEFFNAVRNSTMGRMDNRLLAAASDTSTEATQADGGYAVPVDAKRDIFSYVLDQGQFLPLTDQYGSVSNVMSFPTDTVQGDASTYVASWTAETGTIAEKKVNLGTLSVTAHKLAVAVNASDELLQDANAMQTFISRKAGEAFAWATNAAIFSGTGTGQPKGVVAGAAYSQVATGSWSAAGSITARDVLNMYYRMPQQNRGNAIWVVSPSVEGLLPTLIMSGATVPAFLPPGGLSASPYGTLLGRPVYVSPHAKALGAVGDISFIDFSKYLTLVKSPGVKSDVSMHVYFLNDLQTFRFTMRLGGTNWLTAAQTLGGVTYSPYVGLAVR